MPTDQINAVLARFGLPHDRMLDGPEVCRALHITKKTLATLVEQGTLPGRKLGRSYRYDPADVARLLVTGGYSDLDSEAV